jgi:hypothetical protein
MQLFAAAGGPMYNVYIRLTTPETLVDGHTPSPYEEVTLDSRNVASSAPMASGEKRASGIFEQPAGMKQVQTKSEEQ